MGESHPIQAMCKLLPVVAASNSTVLITGESGTGKEVVAKLLHGLSSRAEANFVPINCGAIPKDLIESELFGHSKGAFTGAVTDRIGRFELANNGTIFLDEIGDLPLELQVRLLRVLQERVVDPVGGARHVQVDVRVIAATHRDLDAEIAAGRFREDLFYRLNVLPLNTPPLRECIDDLPILLDYFARHYTATGGKPISFARDFLHGMRLYQWPGNVRELSNLVDRFSTLFAGQRLELRSFPVSVLPKGLAAIKAAIDSGEVSAPPDEEPQLPVGDEASPLTALLRMDEEVSGSALTALDESPDGAMEPNAIEQMTFLSQGLPILPPEGLSLKH
ncbi:MAG: sigma-54 interaction domain-containing protein, partial [Rhodoferax sp.]